jgi:hypothetical protein
LPFAGSRTVGCNESRPVSGGAGTALNQCVSRARMASALSTANWVEAIRRCEQDHTWERLKVCARDTCRCGFYDASRNQTRRWRSMSGCGNTSRTSAPTPPGAPANNRHPVPHREVNPLRSRRGTSPRDGTERDASSPATVGRVQRADVSYSRLRLSTLSWYATSRARFEAVTIRRRWSM